MVAILACKNEPGGVAGLAEYALDCTKARCPGWLGPLDLCGWLRCNFCMVWRADRSLNGLGQV